MAGSTFMVSSQRQPMALSSQPQLREGPGQGIDPAAVAGRGHAVEVDDHRVVTRVGLRARGALQRRTRLRGGVGDQLADG